MSIASPPQPPATRNAFAGETSPPTAPPALPAPLAVPSVAPAAMPGPDGPRPPVVATVASQRLVSLDAFRGLVMVLMVSAGLYIPKVVQNLQAAPEFAGRAHPVWNMLAF